MLNVSLTHTSVKKVDIGPVYTSVTKVDEALLVKMVNKRLFTLGLKFSHRSNLHKNQKGGHIYQ